jgi:hypothetical protein
MNRQALIFVSLLSCSVVLAAASDKKAANVSNPKADVQRTLTVVKELTIKSEVSGIFVDPARCDSDGNIYLMTSLDPSDGIRMFSNKGEVLAHFTGNSASDIPVQVAAGFWVGGLGEVYQIAFPRDDLRRAVLVFDKDGRYKAGVRLDNPPGVQDWVPYHVAVFSSGDLLLSGLVNDSEKRISTPFTGIFSSNGQLLRRVSLSDDGDIQKMVEAGDPRVVAADRPYANKAVSAGQVDAASDGNVYLLRNVSPVIIYAISPAGQVVRRFTVDIDAKFVSMHIAGRRIALLHRLGETQNIEIKVVDLEGHPVATYREAAKEGHSEFGGALACYSENPERFTFLSTSKDGFLQFRVAEPR